ncbi:MAG: hypothetical protein L3J45_10950 [Flavobacteriaceae bacterium]|nr:hypothetical protein [Flavobacteriaceae bacterium]
MKKIFYLIILLSVLTQSCVDQASDDIVFTIFNQTDKNVKVLGFKGMQRAEPININPNSSFKVTRITGLDDNTLMSFYSLRNGVDSVRVVFNNERFMVYGGATGSNCYICSGDVNYQHFITEQDYQNAEDCNGNCD